jgi:hypothetical protein
VPAAEGWFVRQTIKGSTEGEARMDEDLVSMSREQLIEEVRKLRGGIRAHRDSTGHDLCWHHPALWGLLPEKQDPVPTVPEWPEFLRGCIRYPAIVGRTGPGGPAFIAAI